MQNFIVLGYIPGTDYQTGFGFWLVVSTVFLAFVLRLRIYDAIRRLRRHLTMRRIARTIDRFDLVSI